MTPTQSGVAATYEPPAGVAVPSAAQAEERRLVTALFCDLVGFTPLSERLDPEEVRDIQANYFQQMRQQIERYGGTVEKYAGDAVLALFGAPIAHEDDAERAVLCALGMQEAIEPVAAEARERWRVEPAIRVGVNTGEVVSGVWDTGGRQDVAVTGDAVNTAARIQAAAEPGEVLVAEEVMRLTRRRILYGARRELVLKGKEGVVAAYPAAGVREQVGERWEEREYLTPLIGRDRELRQLIDAWERARDGEGQLVMVMGDAGVGKSRLVAELVETARTQGAVQVVRGRSLSYGQEISLWLIADLLRTIFELRKQESSDEIRIKLQTAVPGILAVQDAGTQADATDVLGEVLGLPAGHSLVAHAGAQVRRQVLIRSLRLVLAAISARGSAMVVLEDLHWVDEASEEVLKEVLADVPGLRILVVTTQRPGWNAPWSEWGWMERLTLRPLSEMDALRLAGAVLGGVALSEELEHYVAERAAGNPFFVEEMLRALLEAGDLIERGGQMHLARGAVERLPNTLTEVLLARLDRLDPEVRALTQVGSVIGRSFGVALLARMVGGDTAALEPALASLQRAEIAFPRRNPDLEYVFKHVSMREVAYNTLLHKRRQELHLAAARAMAALYPSDEYVEMIAYHYSRTDEHREAAIWLERAGDRAAAIYANETAIENYKAARRRLELCGAEPVVPPHVDEKLGEVLRTAGRYDEALTALTRAVEAFRQVRDLEGVGRATARIGAAHRNRGTPQEGIAQIRPLLDLLAWSGPSQGLASLHLALANLYMSTSRLKECWEAAERAGELARAVGDERVLAGAEMRRGSVLTIFGRIRDAIAILDRSIQLAEAVGDLETLGIAHNNLAEAYMRVGELEQARGHLQRGLELLQRVGSTGNIGFQMLSLGEVLAYEGEWERAFEWVERGAEVIASVDASWFAAYIDLERGQLKAYQGRWEEARHHLQEALTLAEPIGDKQALHSAHLLLAEMELLEGRSAEALMRLERLIDGETPYLVHLLATLAWAHLEGDDLDRAEDTVGRALTMARQQEQQLELPAVLSIHGMVLARQKRWPEAEGALDEAASLAHAMPYPRAEARALECWGMMLRERGQTGQAQKRLEDGLGIYRRLGAAKDVERMERVLADAVRA